jgi:hypothetical protein
MVLVLLLAMVVLAMLAMAMLAMAVLAMAVLAMLLLAMVVLAMLLAMAVLLALLALLAMAVLLALLAMAVLLAMAMLLAMAVMVMMRPVLDMPTTHFVTTAWTASLITTRPTSTAGGYAAAARKVHSVQQGTIVRVACAAETAYVLHKGPRGSQLRMASMPSNGAKMALSQKRERMVNKPS